MNNSFSSIAFSQSPKGVLLFDIEGTITSIQFVHYVLFPYAQKNLVPFVLREQVINPLIRDCLEQVRTQARDELKKEVSLYDSLELLLYWIKIDRKVTALKTLQGLLWREGYEKGDFTGHLYADVYPQWKKWKQQGFVMAIYSSGSVAAQRLLLQYSDYGDMTDFFSGYFDTLIGLKQNMKSYQRIKEEAQKYFYTFNLKKVPLVFFSDRPEETAPARDAGFRTYLINRDGGRLSENEASYNNLSEIDLTNL
jgi:enolase-phosphatase E1